MARFYIFDILLFKKKSKEYLILLIVYRYYQHIYAFEYKNNEPKVNRKFHGEKKFMLKLTLQSYSLDVQRI